jgi:hypothetical protein
MVMRAMPLALAQLRAGSPEKAQEMVERIEKDAEVDMDAAAAVGMYWAWAGDSDRAFHFLDRGDELGYRTLRVLENPARFGVLHDDPRWKPYIERVRGKVEELRKEMVWPLR